jgi:hypothetical protein
LTTLIPQRINYASSTGKPPVASSIAWINALPVQRDPRHAGKALSGPLGGLWRYIG